MAIFRRWKGIGRKKSRASPALEGMQGVAGASTVKRRWIDLGGDSLLIWV